MSLATDFESTAPEQPNLWLAMVGFDPDQKAAIEASLTRPGGAPCWHTSDFGEADAWLVNGGKCCLLPGGDLMVEPGSPAGQSVRLDLSEVDRPVAFATPLACEDLEPLCTFDPASHAASMARCCSSTPG